MDETTKRAIKKTILALRKLLEKEDIPAVLKQHGIFPDGRRVPIEKLALLDDNGRKRRERLEAIIDREVQAMDGDLKAGIHRYCREVTFTYLNRLVALRCMEVRGLTDECIKTRDDYAGRSLRHHRFLMVGRTSRPTIARASSPDTLQFDAEDTDSFKAFLRSIFRELQDDIRILFDPDDEYSIIIPSLQALRECIRTLNEDIPEEAFKEPELLGWVYQYFQTEEKDRVFEEVRTKKKKIEGDDIVPATSLYTERYMVDYLVQNSLGAIWMEMYPDSKLCENWPYFVKDQDLKPVGQASRLPRPVKTITFLDPACGSGHFLLVAFDLFVQMYEEEWKMYGGRSVVSTDNGLSDGGRSVVSTDTKVNISEFSIRRRHLPHWELPGAVYYITVTLKNRDDIDLTRGNIAPIIVNAFHFYDKKRYFLYEYTVMPDHFHIIIQPIEKVVGRSSRPTMTEPLHKILKDIKSYTAHEINKVLARSGHVWLDESYDRIIRDEKEYIEKGNYIYENPFRKELIDSPEKWPWFGRGSSGMLSEDAPMSDGDVRPTNNCPFPIEDLVPPEKVATTILESNLHGIDIDLRSVQIAWLALYLRMREYQMNVGGGRPVDVGRGRPTYELPSKVNLVAADASLLNTPEFLSWCEDKFKGEPYALRIIKGIVGRLRYLSEIGSLARPEDDLKELISREKEKLISAWEKGPEPRQLPLFKEIVGQASSRSTQLELPFDKITDDQFWEGVLSRVTDALDEYYRQAAERGDTRVQIFAHEAIRGFKFLELCNKRYDVVATNPPYMGSKNMGKDLKGYVQSTYPEGKRDLYAAFILRCRELTRRSDVPVRHCMDVSSDIPGIIAMVTQQSWMFLRSFVNMREQILKENSIQTLAHLGEHAFDDSAAAGAFVVLFTLANEEPSEEHYLTAFRLLVGENSVTKSSLLKRCSEDQIVKSLTNQYLLQAVPLSRFIYWAPKSVLELFSGRVYLGEILKAKQGMSTADNNRFLRFHWEVINAQLKWFAYSKGGGYCKWFGIDYYSIDWEEKGQRIKAYPASAIRNEAFYFKPGWTFTKVARGALGVRKCPENWLFDAKGPALFIDKNIEYETVGLLNTRSVTYLLRLISPTIEFGEGHIMITPLPKEVRIKDIELENVSKACIMLKTWVIRKDIIERSYIPRIFVCQLARSLETLCERNFFKDWLICAILHSLEGFLEHKSFYIFQIEQSEKEVILRDLGTPAGWHPLIGGYDAVPMMSGGDATMSDEDVRPTIEIPKEVIDYLEKHEHIKPLEEEFAKIKSRLRSLYEAGAGAKIEDVVEEEDGRSDVSSDNDEEEAETGEDACPTIGKRIPIPTETFLEELSVKMEIHPISIYWLLKEMREKEGLVCWPECKRYVEDYFTVMILRMLGFRWPKQVEADEPVPDWADKDGIIPMMSGGDARPTMHTGEKTLLERIRDRIGAEFGEDRIADIEAEFADILYNAACKEAEIKGKTPPRKKITLAQWLEKEFFKRHTSQFKRRPIAWHLASSNGTFQVLLFYHKLSSDILRNLKNRYLAKVQSYYGTILERARRGESVPGGLTADKLTDIEAELEDFAAKLDKVMALPYEPLLDDGVRVNIASLQKAGLLASPVLAAKDVDRAIADRNRWREDDKEQDTIWHLTKL